MVAREAHGAIYTHAGPEIGVASTKAFTSQLTALFLLAMKLGQLRGRLDAERSITLMEELSRIPAKIEEVLRTRSSQCEELATHFSNARDFLYLGRGINYPVALEGALKLKEISYIHAEGYPAAEMKHGPIALVSEKCPSVFFAPAGEIFNKIVSSMQEIKARKGPIIAILTEGSELPPNLADDIISIPSCHEAVLPIVASIPVQLLSYYIAVERGCDVDKPRNLAKSVTVE
jgi:glucosamine--fructose-6-phosphate aminotransferase (isomerizing)